MGVDNAHWLEHNGQDGEHRIGDEMTATRQMRETTNIPSLLRARGHAMTWFCSMIGYDRTYVYRMEAGDRPLTREYVDRAARVLNVPAALLLTDMSILDNHVNVETEVA